MSDNPENFFEALEAELQSPAPQLTTKLVYFIEATETHLIKIGITANVEMRLRILQVGSPVSLKVLAAFAHPDAAMLERTLHKRLASYRQHGEWFALPPAAVQILKTLGDFSVTALAPVSKTVRTVEPLDVQHVIVRTLATHGELDIAGLLRVLPSPQPSYQRLRQLLSVLSKQGHIRRVRRGSYVCTQEL